MAQFPSSKGTLLYELENYILKIPTFPRNQWVNHLNANHVHTVCSIKYTHSFVVLCFVMVISSSPAGSYDVLTVFKISPRPQTLTGKIWVGPTSFLSLSYINFGTIVFWSGKFHTLFENCINPYPSGLLHWHYGNHMPQLTSVLLQLSSNNLHLRTWGPVSLRKYMMTGCNCRIEGTSPRTL